MTDHPASPKRTRTLDGDRVLVSPLRLVGEEDKAVTAVTPGFGKIRTDLSLRIGACVPGTPYRLVRWVGMGGMGSVFEAIHDDIEKRVAIKILHYASTKRQSSIQGFRNEARASARIGARNIVDVFDFKELADGRLLIAMEFLNGHDLTVDIQKGPMPLKRLIPIARQVCKALTAAHEAGIVHRDLKPDNIMVIDKGGRTDHVKLLDFGIASFRSDEGPKRQAGTPAYMDPHSLAADPGPTNDIYSFGCVLFELATTKLPFDGPPDEVALAHALDERPAPSSVVPEAAALDEIVARCLATDPAERFPSAVELEAALCELQIRCGIETAWDDLPIPAVEAERAASIEQGLRPQKERSSRRLRYGAAAVAAVALASVAALVGLRSPEGAQAVAQSDPHADRVERLTLAAREAASQAYFVYPPHDNPQGSTALREVIALERLDTPQGIDRASELRDEFRRTLVRLGDRYWDYPGARAFAHEYYAMAILFGPDPHAAERSALTDTALDRLRHKAIDGGFTQLELTSTMPLVALAKESAAERTEGLRRARAKSSLRSAARIDRVLDAQGGSVAQRPHNDPPPVKESGATSQEDEPVAENSRPGRPSRLTPGARDDKVDGKSRKVSSKLAGQAKSAFRRGRHKDAEALFNRALAIDDANIDALDGLGDLYFARSRYPQSLKMRKKAARQRPSSARRQLALGDAYFKTSHFHEAQAAYGRAKSLGHPKADARLAKVLSKLGANR